MVGALFWIRRWQNARRMQKRWAYIKSVIDTGIPPICYCPGGKGHWMLAFDYTSGSSFEDIIIIDPADGTRKSLAAGMNLSCNGTSLGITKIRKAPSKH